MIVTIPIAQDCQRFYAKTFFLRDYCRVCGEKRGVPKDRIINHNQTISIWNNTCGHQDDYSAALEEYTRKLRFTYRGRGDKYQPVFNGLFNTNPVKYFL